LTWHRLIPNQVERADDMAPEHPIALLRKAYGIRI